MKVQAKTLIQGENGERVTVELRSGPDAPIALTVKTSTTEPVTLPLTSSFARRIGRALYDSAAQSREAR